MHHATALSAGRVPLTSPVSSSVTSPRKQLASPSSQQPSCAGSPLIRCQPCERPCPTRHSPAVRTTCRALARNSSSSSRLRGRRCRSSTDSPDARTADVEAREVERSSLVNEEAVYLVFQLDLDTQLQRALNYEAYQQVQEIRRKRQKVDEALAAMQERKASNAGAEGAGGTAVVDVAAQGLELRTAMARAVEREDYKEAGVLKAALAQLERQVKQAEAVQSRLTGQAGFAPKLRLGQRLFHAKHGYRAVVVGWDAQCCESEEWQQQAGTAALSRGTQQPFYHVLVDLRDWERDSYQPPVAYVAEELCWVPELDGPGTMPAQAQAARDLHADSQDNPQKSLEILEEGTSWVEAFGHETFQHPYTYIMFLGQDGRGDYIPCRQLRDKYNVQRRDVYAPGGEGQQDQGMSGPD